MGVWSTFDEKLLGKYLQGKFLGLSLLLNFSFSVIFYKGTFLKEEHFHFF